MYMNILNHTKSVFSICVCGFWCSSQNLKKKSNISNLQHIFIFIFMANSVKFYVKHICVSKIVESYSNRINFLYQNSSECAQYVTQYTESYLNNLIVYTQILISIDRSVSEVSICGFIFLVCFTAHFVCLLCDEFLLFIAF